MELIRDILSNNLIHFRKSKGFTQVELANMLEVMPSTYNQWEKGAAWPSSTSLERLAILYNIRSSRLFYDPDMLEPQADSWSNRASPKEIKKKLQELIDLID